MEIAEETDRLSIRPNRHQHARFAGFSDPLGLYRIALFVYRLEMTAIEDHVVLVLAGQHGVRLGSGSHENAASRQGCGLPGRDQLAAFGIEPQLGERNRLGMPVRVDFHGFRRQAFGKLHAFGQGVSDFFVVQRVAWGIDEAPAIGYGGSAPGVQKWNQVYRTAIAGGGSLSARIARPWAMNSRPVARSSGVQLSRTACSPRSAARVS